MNSEASNKKLDQHLPQGDYSLVKVVNIFFFQTYFVAIEDMMVAFSIFPGLRLKMWKVAAIPIVSHLYLQNYEYEV